MKLPSFLGIGAQKAATSWLYLILMEHPEIWMPPIKELHFFDHLYVPKNRKWTRWHIKKSVRSAIKWHILTSNCMDLGYLKYLCDLAIVDVFSESWYQHAFSRPHLKEKVIGEVTPEYCTVPREGVEHVKAMLGDIKLIYIIRDPVDRALSQIRMGAERQYGDGIDELSDEQWHEVAVNTPVINRGNYRTYIPNWLSVFGERNMLFIPFGKIGNDPREVLDMVERHLGVSNYEGYSSIEKPVHVTRNIDIPDSAIEHLADELSQQRAYLQTCFDADFISMI